LKALNIMSQGLSNEENNDSDDGLEGENSPEIDVYGTSTSFLNEVVAAVGNEEKYMTKR